MAHTQTVAESVDSVEPVVFSAQASFAPCEMGTVTGPPRRLRVASLGLWVHCAISAFANLYLFACFFSVLGLNSGPPRVLATCCTSEPQPRPSAGF